MTMKKLTLSLLFIIFYSGNSFSASFNCGLKGLSYVENKICEVKVLSDYDEKLSRWYKVISRVNINRLFQYQIPDLKKDQKIWIKQRNKCKEVECITSSYKQRIGILRGIYFKIEELTTKKFLFEYLSENYPNYYKGSSAISEVLYASVILGHRAEYLITTTVSMGIGSSFCGGGVERGYIYLKVNLENNKIEKIERMSANDCGANLAQLSHNIHDDGYNLKITMYFDRDFSGVDKAAFNISVNSVEDLKDNFNGNFSKKNDYPEKKYPDE
jgi:uncharacterized protein